MFQTKFASLYLQKMSFVRYSRNVLQISVFVSSSPVIRYFFFRHHRPRSRIVFLKFVPLQDLYIAQDIKPSTSAPPPNVIGMQGGIQKSYGVYCFPTLYSACVAEREKGRERKEREKMKEKKRENRESQ